MGTWVGAPRQVFDRMTEPFADTVHTDHEITSVKKQGGRYAIADRHGRSYEVDKVIFACDATSALNALESPTWLQRTLLGNTQYVDDIDPQIFDVARAAGEHHVAATGVDPEHKEHDAGRRDGQAGSDHEEDAPEAHASPSRSWRDCRVQ